MSRLWRIALREYFSYLRTPGFWISLLATPLVLGFLVLGGPKALTTPAPLRLAVVDLSGIGFEHAVALALSAGAPEAVLAPLPASMSAASSPSAAAAALSAATGARGSEGPDIAAIVSGPPTSLSLEVWAPKSADPALVALLQQVAAQKMREARMARAGVTPAMLHALDAAAPQVRQISAAPSKASEESARQASVAVALYAAFLLWMTVMTSAGILLNSVIEEKSGRILEVLMSSASIPEILCGKIVGVAAMTATVLAVWGALGGALMLKSSPDTAKMLLSGFTSHGLGVYFVLFFVVGYVVYAAVFAAVGAFSETVREAQTLVGPMMILISVPIIFLSLAIQRPDTPVIAVLSWLPPFTPFLMTARVAMGLPAWQAVLSLLLTAGTAAGVLWLCGRAFRAGALSSGGMDVKRLLKAAFRVG